jgi:cytochrome c-type biogenesis protein
MTRIRGAFWGGGAVLLVGGIYLSFTASQQMPAASWLAEHPLSAVGLAGATGFVDGLNPCAITTLLLFVGALLALVETQSARGEGSRARATVWMVAGAYILGIFALYFSLGTGFIEVTSVRSIGNTHVFTRVAGLLAVLLGFVMVREFFYPDSGPRLTMPARLHGVARRWGRSTTVGGALVGGVLIGLCTIPCGGAMYLAVAAMIGTLSSRPYAYTLLLTYNIAFVLPLVLLVAVAGSREALRGLSRLHVTHRRWVKPILGVFVMAVGFFALL